MEKDAFLTQIPQSPIKISPQVVIQDEELEKIKKIYISTYNEYKEALERLNNDKFESKNIFFSRKSFFNNEKKIQEFRRGRFFSSLLNAKSYTHTLDNYQELLTEKIRNNSNSHILPEGIELIFKRIKFGIKTFFCNFFLQ